MTRLLFIAVLSTLAGCASSPEPVVQPSGVVVEPAGADSTDWTYDARDKNQRPYGHSFERRLPTDASPTWPTVP